jgi:hypothetical protein
MPLRSDQNPEPFNGDSWELLLFAQWLEVAAPSLIQATINMTSPRSQQNTPRVPVKPIGCRRDIVCVRSQTLKVHVPTDRTRPKRLMDAAAYRSLLKLFCAIDRQVSLLLEHIGSIYLKVLRVVALMRRAISIDKCWGGQNKPRDLSGSRFVGQRTDGPNGAAATWTSG